MDKSFFIYLEQLEVIAFFSGYFLIYLLVGYAGEILLKRKILFINLVTLLPYTYALTGVLFLGFQLKNLYPYYDFKDIINIQNIFLKIWALLSILFFIPALAKKPALSLWHSFAFFYFIIRDLFLYFFYTAGNNMIKNDMAIYTKSLLLNLSSFAVITLFYFAFFFLKARKKY
jgi:hypothetical protein